MTKNIAPSNDSEQTARMATNKTLSEDSDRTARMTTYEALREDSGQTVRMRRPIWVLAGRTYQWYLCSVQLKFI